MRNSRTRQRSARRLPSGFRRDASCPAAPTHPHPPALCAVPVAGDCEGLGVEVHRGELHLRSHSTAGLSFRVLSPLLSPSQTRWEPHHPALRTCQFQLNLHLSTPNRELENSPHCPPQHQRSARRLLPEFPGPGQLSIHSFNTLALGVSAELQISCWGNRMDDGAREN